MKEQAEHKAATEDKAEEEVFYQSKPKETSFITGDVVKRLEEYVKAEAVLPDAYQRVQDNENNIDPDEFNWAMLMYDRFKNIYWKLIFDNLPEDQVKEKIANEYPSEFLGVHLKKSLTYVNTVYQTAAFFSIAKNVKGDAPETALFKEKASKQSESAVTLAGFAEEIVKRIQNLQDGHVLNYAQLAGAYAERNKTAMIYHAKKEIEKDKQQRQEASAFDDGQNLALPVPGL